MQLEYQFSVEPDADKYQLTDEAARAMARMVAAAGNALKVSRWVQFTAWLITSVRYRRTRKEGDKWFVSYHFPLC